MAPSAPSKVSVPVAIDNGSMGTRAVRRSHTTFVSASVFKGTASHQRSYVIHGLRIPREGTRPRLNFSDKGTSHEVDGRTNTASNAFLIRAGGHYVMER